MSLELYDITILGAGPTGLFAAYYAGLRQMRTKVIDSLDQLGGQLVALYPEKFLFDIPGFPRVLARDLAAGLIDQAKQYAPTVVLNEVISTLEPATEIPGHGEQIPAPLYRLTSNTGAHYTRTVLIAAGSGAFSPKKLSLVEAAAFEGRSLFYSVAHGRVFSSKRVLIIGGGDSAVDWALNLQDVAESVTLIHRRNQFRAHEGAVRELQKTRAAILPFFELESLVPDGAGALSAAVVRNNQTGEVRTLEVDAVLAQIGFNSTLGPLKEWPLVLEKHGVRVNHEMETSQPGVFAAGDVAIYPGKLKLIVNGFAEATTAVNYAKTRVDPGARVFPGHSSELVSQTQSITTV